MCGVGVRSAPGRVHGVQPLHGLQRRPDRGPVPTVVDGGCRRHQPRRAGLVQVRWLPFHQRFQPPQLPGPGHPPSGPEGIAARRDLLLHLPGHQLRGGRQAPPAASGGATRLRRVSVFLPAPSGRTHRPGFGVPAPDTAAPRSPGRGGGPGAVADLAGTVQEGCHRQLPGHARGRPAVRGARPPCRYRGPLRRVRLRHSDLRRLQRLHRHRHRAGPACSGSASRRTSIHLTDRCRCRSSGGAGT